ncbi:S41 family peptidase [Dactylosporangium sp. NPDC049140]|uniref:S41 family peptidase n=1 Tax=Dactylosporangium sp. NPDC049140 TaxID=3155647 RepID=UPI0033EED217
MTTMVGGMKNKLWIAAGMVASAALIGYATTFMNAPASSAETSSRPPACAARPIGQPSTPPSGGSVPVQPTTITTIEQAYYCIFDNYYSGSVLDDRTLLVPAFAALAQELQRRGLDQSQATTPALTGRKDADWAAFSRAYQKIAAKLPEDSALQQAVAEATLQGMVAALGDNHANWSRLPQQRSLLGLKFSGLRLDGTDPAIAAPIFVTAVAPGSGAESAGIKPGDEVVAVNGVPLILNGIVSDGVVEWLTTASPEHPLQFTLRRPVTGKTFTTTVTPVTFPQQGPKVETKLLPGDIAYVTIPGFYPGVADQALNAIADLRKNTTLRGIILDLRGNGGGSGAEKERLLGAFVHGKTTSYWCDVRDHCTTNHPDDTVPLLNLPLVALTDRNCASSCDSFASTVKDLHLGTLVGTRTAGLVSGPTLPYMLDDNSELTLPSLREIGANREIVNTIGVAPDHMAPMTGADLSAGRDPGVAKALTLLR